MYRRQKLDWESNLETIEEATPEAEEQDTPQTMSTETTGTTKENPDSEDPGNIGSNQNQNQIIDQIPQGL